MDEQRIRSVIESILFVSDRPISAREIADVLREGFDTKGVKGILDEMINSSASQNRGWIIREVAGGYQLCTNPENAEYLRRLIDIKPFRLSRAALETLAIIAYRQPVTKSEIEEIRGVDSTGAIRVIMERRLIKIVGKKDEPGRPFLYGTTKEFMEFFDLKSLSDLPTLKDLEEIVKEINEESGVPLQRTEGVSLDVNLPPKIEPIDKDTGRTDINDVEEVREEAIIGEFEEALNRVEDTNRLIRETLEISDPQDLQSNYLSGDPERSEDKNVDQNALEDLSGEEE